MKERSSGGGGGTGTGGAGTGSSLGLAGSSIRSSRNKSRVPKDSRILGSNIFTEHSGKLIFMGFSVCFKAYNSSTSVLTPVNHKLLLQIVLLNVYYKNIQGLIQKMEQRCVEKP